MKGRATATPKRSAMKVKLSSILKKPSSHSASTISDKVWDLDPCLAASLALAPLNDPSRKASVPKSKDVGPTKAIDRDLPPKLAALKTKGTWDKTTSGAVGEYLVSLRDRFGFDTQALIETYKTSKPSAKRGLAEKLVLCKDNADMKGVETDHCSEETRKTTRKGWVSAYEIWHAERIPCVAETRDTRVACLMVLERKPHPNPIRAQQGEFVFHFEKQEMDKITESHGKDIRTTASSAIAGADDLKLAKRSLAKAFGPSDDGSCKAKAKAKPKAKPIPIDELQGQEKTDAINAEKKKDWLRDARKSQGRLANEETSMVKTMEALQGYDVIPPRIAKELEKMIKDVGAAKNKLATFVNSENVTLAKQFTTSDYSKSLLTAATLIEAFQESEFIHKKAKKALQLAAL